MAEVLERHVALGEPLGREAQAHLSACGACQAELAFLEEVHQALLEDVPEVAPPPSLRTPSLEVAGPHVRAPPCSRWVLRPW
ncbi:hypothetical protein [Deinococcus hopiensis]|uniref:Zinc-finger n=1 Tax=Deinococcus hopiensis KR-140 TaxID=695939 RepID=A0A1W1VC95_9DEIO|nr:hypothetical protein [Deinococcus hopiensis]SMB90916.1 hypothetical protein SAMN00790413_00934 [Deinococcus hopiensis KR-140]